MQSAVQQNQMIQQSKPTVQIQPQQQVQSQVQTQPQVQQSVPQQAYMTSPQAQQPVAQQYYAPQMVQQPQAQTGTNANSPNYAGVNIQIFNPSVATPGATAPVYNVNAPSYQTGQQAPTGCYPSNYYTQPLAAQTDTKPVEKAPEKTEDKKKTEKRNIVQLTDEYIKTLENYLNSQDKEVRMMGAKEVVARLQEDDSRKDDLALNALVNKMLQDPYQNVKMLALGVLDSRQCSGNDYTVGVLQNMQTQETGYGQDAKTATNILLKMAGKTVEKEFEVKDKPKTEEDKK